VIEPVIKPTIGFNPKVAAKLTPTMFWTTIKSATTARKMNNPTPPALSREKSALKPMEEKKKRKITRHEWLLIAMVLVGVLLVLMRWEAISKAVVAAFSAYFE